MWLKAAAPAGEILLGCWFLSGAARFGAWLTAFVTFSLFAVITSAKVRAGASDCGCLGSAVSVPPTVTLVLDVGLVVALLAFRPRWAGWPAFGPGLRTAVATVAVAGLVLAAGVGFAVWRYGSVAGGAAAAAGVPVAVTTPVVDVGEVPAGGIADGAVEILNLTDAEEQVAYISMRCRCAAFDGLSITLPPGQPVRIGFRLRAPAEPGAFRRPAVVESSAGSVHFEMVGVAVAPR